MRGGPPHTIAIVNAPATEPVSLADLKRHLRVDHGHEDEAITAIGVAARAWLESVTGLALITQTIRQTEQVWPGGRVIELARFPVQSITSIQYRDGDDAVQTLASSAYRLEIDDAAVVLAANQTWPDITQGPGAVKITFVAGVDDAASVNPMAAHAIRLLAGHFFENREASISGTIIAELPRGIRDLVAQLRRSWL